MERKLLAILIIVWLSVCIVNAQAYRISGIVTDSEQGNPVPGVSVVVKGLTLGTVTNQDGYYQLNLSDQAQVLVFSYIGMKTLELPIEGSVINVVLEPDNIGVDEVVVVAYDKSVKERFTGSVSTISASRLERFQTTGFTKALQGLVSGILTTSGSGQPGEDAEIRIRGFSTFGDASPLIVLDGFPFDGNLSSIPLSEIETISVLKDALATSLYGSRAANGVILLNTKTGLSGTSKLNLNVRYGITSRAIPEYDRVSVPEYYELQWEGIRNALVGSGLSPDDAAKRASDDLVSTLGGYNAFDVPDNELINESGEINSSARLLWNDNWHDELFVMGERKEILLSSSGGTEKSTYFLSGSVLNEDGIIKSSNFKRYAVRSNVKTEFNSWISAGINLSASFSEQNFPESTSTSNLNAFHFAGMIAPIYPVYLYDQSGKLQTDAEGNRLYDYGTGFGRSRSYGSNLNPLGTIDLDKRLYKRDVFTIRSFIDFKINEGLHFNSSLSADNYAFNGLTHKNMRFGDGQNFNGRSFRESTRTFSYTANQMLRFEKEFGKQAVKAIAAHENYNYKFNVLSAARSGFPFPGLTELDGAATAEGSGSFEDNYRLESYFAKVDYNLDEKYFASLNFRADGNSRFAKNVRWGNYWGAGFSWLVSNESFIKDKYWLNTLRFKASYGEQGNDKIGSYYAYQGLYETGVNNINYPGVLASRLTTPGLTWETMKSLNIGAEIKWIDRFAVQFEYYIRNNNDLLFEKPLPPSTGFTSIDANIARLSNVGFDLEMSGLIIHKQNLSYNVNVNLGHFTNQIKEIPQEFIINGNNRWEVGLSVYDFWMEDFAGVNTENGKSQWYYDIAKTDVNGNIIYNNNGNPVLTGERGITEDYGKADRYYAGKSIPDLFGGINNMLTILGFDLSVLLNFGIGGKVLDQPYQWLMHSGSYGIGFHRDILNRWTPENPNPDIPLIDGDQLANRRSDRFLTDAGYFDIRNISAGYQLPKSLVSRFNLEEGRLSITADNVALLTARKGLDPRQSLDGNLMREYVPVRTVSVGFDLHF